ncbi:thioredoxin fold domain-containing protein [Candidatus Dependentiae bacterium]|nr:thioredoxin fold domain-containing protein [Candidatus Dependentiae bacterium]
MKKIMIFLCMINLILFSGCKMFEGWFKKSKPMQEVIDTNIIKIDTSDKFENEVLGSSKPVVVKFETDWCGACRSMAPTYEKVADEFVASMKFTQVDADKHKELAQKYEVKGVPTFIFFKNGELVEKIEGSMDEDNFKEKIKEILNK